MRALQVKGVAVLLFSAGAVLSCGKGEPAAAASGVDVSAAKLEVSAACGGKGQPDCPLQNWMKSTLQPYQRENNYARLERAFEDLAQHAPDDYEHWADLASSGAEAARNKDAAGVRTACKSCHDQHRSRYRRERRAEQLM
jgi:hypothetical protein